MALKTQFKGWNRNQPLVIYAKEKYDQLMDDYQLISRYTIINMTLCIIFTIITTTFVFILYIDPVAAFASILPTVFCWIYTRRVVHHTIGSPVNKEIDEIAKMEQDEILRLNMEKIGNLIYRLELSSIPKDPTEHRGKGGFFFEYSLCDREEFFSKVTEKYQTITQFGVEVSTLRDQIVSHNLCGIDRIVPVGQAMNIGVIWDGHDLVRALSRIINSE